MEQGTSRHTHSSLKLFTKVFYQSATYILKDAQTLNACKRTAQSIFPRRAHPVASTPAAPRKPSTGPLHETPSTLFHKIFTRCQCTERSAGNAAEPEAHCFLSQNFLCSLFLPPQPLPGGLPLSLSLIHSFSLFIIHAVNLIRGPVCDILTQGADRDYKGE